MITYFQTRNDMLASFNKEMVIAELGVFEGDFSKDIMNICSPKELYLVDLFEGTFGSGDKDGLNHHEVDLSKAMKAIQVHFKNTKGVKVVKQSTSQFMLTAPERLLDMVYIDADHSYESVKSDLFFSKMKVKKGGYICGHDYVDGTQAKYAVDDFCSETGLEISILTLDGCPSYCIVNY